MMPGLLDRLRTSGRSSPRERVIETLHGRINTAARQPGLYLRSACPTRWRGASSA